MSDMSISLQSNSAWDSFRQSEFLAFNTKNGSRNIRTNISSTCVHALGGEKVPTTKHYGRIKERFCTWTFELGREFLWKFCPHKDFQLDGSQESVDCLIIWGLALISQSELPMPGKQDLSCLFKEIGRSWRNAAVIGRVNTAVHVCTGGWWCKFSQSVNATHAIGLLTPKYSWTWANDSLLGNLSKWSQI